ncbi:predicted protein [Nematostella vectensis]|uniref:Epg5-like central TPR repeats domain-containing protein n=1 Tax=Nematostella vectensis TaxID=45351 RepID=A7SY35_NEMVE|nr:predicted protein [Nematostella vectensis]|eukprot:XP_001623484.1 predicted protein [Nematostella vectensis]
MPWFLVYLWGDALSRKSNQINSAKTKVVETLEWLTQYFAGQRAELGGHVTGGIYTMWRPYIKQLSYLLGFLCQRLVVTSSQRYRAGGEEPEKALQDLWSIICSAFEPWIMSQDSPVPGNPPVAPWNESEVPQASDMVTLFTDTISCLHTHFPIPELCFSADEVEWYYSGLLSPWWELVHTNKMDYEILEVTGKWLKHAHGAHRRTTSSMTRQWSSRSTETVVITTILPLVDITTILPLVAITTILPLVVITTILPLVVITTILPLVAITTILPLVVITTILPLVVITTILPLVVITTILPLVVITTILPLVAITTILPLVVITTILPLVAITTILPLVVITTILPLVVITTILPLVAITTILPLVVITTILPLVVITTILPLVAITTILPLVAITTILPLVVITTILPLVAITTILPLVVITTILPLVVITTILPLVAITTILPLVAITTILPLVAITTILPLVVITTILPLVAITTILPLVAITTTLPLVAITTILPLVVITTILPLVAITTILPLVAITTILPLVAITTILPLVVITTILPLVAITTILPLVAITTILPLVVITTILPLVVITTILPLVAITTILPLVAITTILPLVVITTILPLVAITTILTLVAITTILPLVAITTILPLVVITTILPLVAITTILPLVVITTILPLVVITTILHLVAITTILPLVVITTILPLVAITTILPLVAITTILPLVVITTILPLVVITTILPLVAITTILSLVVITTILPLVVITTTLLLVVITTILPLVAITTILITITYRLNHRNVCREADRHILLDRDYIQLLPRMYTNDMTQAVISVPCRSKFRSGHQCIGPAQITLRYLAKHDNEIVIRQVSDNRQEYETMVKGFLQPCPMDVCTAAANVERIITCLVEKVESNKQRKNKEILSDIGTSLFYQLASTIDGNCLRYQPTLQFFSSCIEILGKTFILHTGSQTEQLLYAILELTSITMLLVPFFCPNESPDRFTAMYHEVLETSDKDLAFSLLSKVSQPCVQRYGGKKAVESLRREMLDVIDKYWFGLRWAGKEGKYSRLRVLMRNISIQFDLQQWLSSPENSLIERSSLASAIIKSLLSYGFEPQPGTRTVLEVQLRHMSLVLTYNFPEQYSQMLRLICDGSSSRSICLEVWNLFLDNIGCIPQDGSKDQGHGPAQPPMLPDQQVVETLEWLTQYFAGQRAELGGHVTGGIYTMWRPYIKQLSYLLGFLCQRLVVTSSQRYRAGGEEPEKALQDLWSIICSAFEPWIMSQDSPVPGNPPVAPWNESEVPQASDMVTLFTDTISCLHTHFPTLQDLWSIICSAFEPWIMSQDSPVPGYPRLRASRISLQVFLAALGPVSPNAEQHAAHGQECIHQSALLTLYTYVLLRLSQCTSPKQEMTVLADIVSWCSRMKIRRQFEDRAPLFWHKILQLALRQADYSGEPLNNVARQLSFLITTLHQLGEDKDSSGLLGAIGFGKKSSYSIRFRFLSRVLEAFILAQLPSNLLLRLEPKAPGYVREPVKSKQKNESGRTITSTAEAESALAALEALRSNKHYSQLVSHITEMHSFIANPLHSLRDGPAMVARLATDLYPEQPALRIMK